MISILLRVEQIPSQAQRLSYANLEWRLHSGMYVQHALEGLALPLERAQHALPEAFASIQGEQQARHIAGGARDSVVRRFVLAHAVAAHRGRQGKRLAKRNREPLTGNRIDRSGGFSDKRDVPIVDMAHAAGGSDCSDGGASYLRTIEPGRQSGKPRQRGGKARCPIAGGEMERDFALV